MIVDWDVHHGNGTQDIFYEDQSVFYFSTHQRPWYPGTGAKDETGRGKGLGTTMNWPMDAGAGRAEFLNAFHALADAVDRFKPELVMISAGFDARHGDPLGNLELTDADYIELTGLVLEMAHRHAERPRGLGSRRRLQSRRASQRRRRSLWSVAASRNIPACVECRRIYLAQANLTGEDRALIHAPHGVVSRIRQGIPQQDACVNSRAYGRMRPHLTDYVTFT